MLGKVLRHHCLVKLAAEFGYVVFKCGILCLQLSDLLFENLREEALVPVLGFRIVALPCSLIRRSISPRCVRSMRLDLLILDNGQKKPAETNARTGLCRSNMP